MVERSVLGALISGLRCRCPSCGAGRMFHGYLKVNDACPRCGEALFHHRADDAPPYVVMLIVGHILVAIMLWLEIAYTPALWLHAAIFLPLTIVLSLALLPPVKGALVAVQWAKPDARLR